MDGNKTYSYEIQSSSKNQVVVVVNGQIRKQEFFVEGNTVYIFNAVGDQYGFKFESDSMKAGESEGAGDKALLSPMPGTVTKVFRKAGDQIKKGESIVAMEAMKMELVLKAQFDCKIVKLNVSENPFVDAGKVLVELEHV